MTSTGGAPPLPGASLAGQAWADGRPAVRTTCGHVGAGVPGRETGVGGSKRDEAGRQRPHIDEDRSAGTVGSPGSTGLCRPNFWLAEEGLETFAANHHEPPACPRSTD